MTRRKKLLSIILSLSMLCSGCTLGQRKDKEEQAEFVIREILGMIRIILSYMF